MGGIDEWEVGGSSSERGSYREGRHACGSGVAEAGNRSTPDAPRAGWRMVPHTKQRPSTCLVRVAPGP